MSDSIQIIQGRTASHDQAKLGLVNVFDGHDVRLDVWNPADKRWLGKLKLKRSDIFPVGGGFLRLQDVGGDGQRANVSLVEFSAAGIGAPAADALALVEGGELDIGDDAVRIVEVDRDGATVETWPKRYPRDVVEADKVVSQRLEPGAVLALGGSSLQVRRLQPRAGEVLGFIEFDLQH
ncbi:hypothetical protein K4L06_04235 [Lysobacter sp. BMK333-48F3]|uniref:hypothetical protein n=1 Tax=Lysobacter sp. BMK333-48F3 TaxID=2867962 RepID=UPI001C8CB9B4|nr:hypothetical protein [Lysobacter sp. BMK333-48F3]MBX9400509.1 hypothetical protein [Lysobacter sp. BMK333-48F3]